ncbi:MAG TPA: hypothetical protein VD766_01490 [Solirubrobacterales bacterium]|nr:hypothetical protein [Solirubrobacterales bacterium]
MLQAARRGIGLSVAACALTLAAADQASAALSCNFNAGTGLLTVRSSGFEEVVALRRDGIDIEITDDAMGGELSCAGGDPTLTNTDDIVLDDLPGAVSPAVYFDYSKGPMTPGIENESPEASEIEIEVEWENGFFGLGGGPLKDKYVFGNSILGPAVKTNTDADGDAFLGSTMSVLLRGERGGDTLSGRGGFGFLSPLEIPMTIEGGAGKDKITGGSDRDILYGEGGKDKLKGGDGRDIFEVEGGKKDKVKCGAGNDRVFADASDKIAADCEKVSVS